jgi:hypothetical protein
MTLVKTLFPLLPFIVFSLLLVGCMPIGLPALFVDVPALTYMGYSKSAFDVASFTGSGKSMSDHMISNMMGKDCAMLNILKSNRNICVNTDKYMIDNVGRYRFDHLYFNQVKPVENNNRFNNTYVNQIAFEV